MSHLYKYINYMKTRNNSILENDVVLFSTILNPSNKFDYFNDENLFQKVKNVIENKVNASIKVKEIFFFIFFSSFHLLIIN